MRPERSKCDHWVGLTGPLRRSTFAAPKTGCIIVTDHLLASSVDARYVQGRFFCSVGKVMVKHMHGRSQLGFSFLPCFEKRQFRILGREKGNYSLD